MFYQTFRSSPKRQMASHYCFNLHFNNERLDLFHIFMAYLPFFVETMDGLEYCSFLLGFRELTKLICESFVISVRVSLGHTSIPCLSVFSTGEVNSIYGFRLSCFFFVSVAGLVPCQRTQFPQRTGSSPWLSAGLSGFANLCHFRHLRWCAE